MYNRRGRRIQPRRPDQKGFHTEEQVQINSKQSINKENDMSHRIVKYNQRNVTPRFFILELKTFVLEEHHETIVALCYCHHLTSRHLQTS